VCYCLVQLHTHILCWKYNTIISQDKKSKESKNYLEDAVSGDKEDDFGSDADNNEPTEHVDDANAMGEC